MCCSLATLADSLACESSIIRRPAQQTITAARHGQEISFVPVTSYQLSARMLVNIVLVGLQSFEVEMLQITIVVVSDGIEFNIVYWKIGY